MTDAIDPMVAQLDQQKIAQDMVDQARAVGVNLVGPVTIDVPRDRDGTFEPAIVRKRQRRCDGRHDRCRGRVRS